MYVSELRADEGGRGGIVEFYADTSRDVLPAKFGAISQVHEYGGRSFTCDPSTGHLIFTDWETKGIFDLDPVSCEIKPLLEANKNEYHGGLDVYPL